MRSGLYAELEQFAGFGRANLLASFALFDDDPARINRLEAEFAKVTPALVQKTAQRISAAGQSNGLRDHAWKDRCCRGGGEGRRAMRRGRPETMRPGAARRRSPRFCDRGRVSRGAEADAASTGPGKRFRHPPPKRFTLSNGCRSRWCRSAACRR